MSQGLKERITEAMKAAMRAQEKERLGTIRLIQAAIKQREVDERIMLNDEQVLGLLDKMIRQRKESIKQFEAGNRPDLVAKENFEVEIIQGFLPSPLSESEIQEMVKEAIKTTGASSVKDMGKVMNTLKPQLQGRADMAMVGNLIKSHLS